MQVTSAPTDFATTNGDRSTELTESFLLVYRPYAGGMASRLATAIYVAMVTPILYDNSYSPNDSNLKYESYQPYG